MSKQSNRDAMPDITRAVDFLREYFPNLKVYYAKENGIEIGGRK